MGILDSFGIQPDFDPRRFPGLLGQPQPQFTGGGLLADDTTGTVPAPQTPALSRALQAGADAAAPAQTPMPPQRDPQMQGDYNTQNAQNAQTRFFPQANDANALNAPSPAPQPSFFERLMTAANKPENDFFGKLQAIGAGIAGGRSYGEGFANGLQNYHTQKLQDAVAQQQAAKAQLDQAAARQKQVALQGAVALAKRANPNLSDTEALAYASNPALFQQAAARVTPSEQYRTEKDADGNLVQVNALTGQKSILVSGKESKDPTSVQEYEYAKKSGYNGSFNDFLNSKNSGGNPFSIVPAGGLALDRNTKQVVADNRTHASLDDNTAEVLAYRLMAGDKSAIQNIGRGAQGAENLTKIQNRVGQIATEKGLNPQEAAKAISEAQQDYSGGLAGARAAGTYNARTDILSSATDKAIDLALDLNKTIPRSNLVPLNRLILAGKTANSDPQLAAFSTALQTVANEYAKAINPTGVASVESQKKAHDLFDQAKSPEALEQVLKTARAEIQRGHLAARNARQLGKEAVPDGPVDLSKGSGVQSTGILELAGQALGFGGNRQFPAFRIMQ